MLMITLYAEQGKQKFFRTAQAWEFSTSLSTGVKAVVPWSGHKAAALPHTSAWFWGQSPRVHAGYQTQWKVAEQSPRAILCLLKGSPSLAALPHLFIINPFKSTLPACCPLPVRHSKERSAGKKPPMGTCRAQMTFQTSSLKGVLIFRNEAWISYDRQAKLWRCLFHPERPNSRAATNENLLEYLSDQRQH